MEQLATIDGISAICINRTWSNMLDLALIAGTAN